MKSSSGFYSSLGLLVLLNAVIKPLWIFAIDRQVQNVAGIEPYGIYFSLFSLSVVLSFLSDLGFTPYLNRKLAAGGEKQESLYGNLFWLKLLLALGFCAVLFVVAALSGIKRWDILIYVALIQVFTSLLLFFRAIITARQWFRADAWLSVTDKSLMIISCGSLLYFPLFAGTMSIGIFLVLQAVCLCIAMIAGFIYLLNKGIRFGATNKWLPRQQMLKQALPFAFIVLLMGAHSRMDAFLLERIHHNGAHEAGIYAGAFRLLDAANMWGYLIASFLLPYIARRWSEKTEINTVVLQCRHLLLFFAVFIISSIVFLAPWIQRVLYHHGNDTYAIEILQWCLPALAGYALVQVYGTVLTATGRVTDFCAITFAALLINITLNLLLIPSLGAKGCCIAALSSQLFCGILSMFYVKQKLKISLQLRSLLIYTFTGILLCGFFYACRNWPVTEWLLILVAGMITAAMMLATKLSGFSALTGWKTKQDY